MLGCGRLSPTPLHNILGLGEQLVRWPFPLVGPRGSAWVLQRGAVTVAGFVPVWSEEQLAVSQALPRTTARCAWWHCCRSRWVRPRGGERVLVAVGFAGERVSVVRSPEPAGREVLLGVRSRFGGGSASLF